MLRFAFNTAGCANHRLFDALDIIAETGFDGAVITLDVHHLDPMADDYEDAAQALKEKLDALNLAACVDTSSRFLLDPREKYEPTLLHPTEDGRALRLNFLRRCAKVCKILDGEAVTFWSGRPMRSVSPANAGAWLLDGLKQTADICAEEGVVAALEPLPGHMVGSLDDFKVVRDAVKQMTTSPIKLALGAGHCLVVNDREPHQAVKEFAPILGNVSIEDMARGEHKHLPLGEGDMDLPTLLAALEEVDYALLVDVKLPLDSHRAPEMIAAAYDYVQEHLPSD